MYFEKNFGSANPFPVNACRTENRKTREIKAGFISTKVKQNSFD